MKRKLQILYWKSILITLLVAAAVIALTARLKIDDTYQHLTGILRAASLWTLDSNEDLQSLADSIAGVSPAIRVTFLLDSGLVLADSMPDDGPAANHFADPEIEAARNGEIGRNIRMSGTNASFVLYLAERVSPQLILRVSYPVFEIARGLLLYGLTVLVLLLVLYLLQRRGIASFGRDQIRQMEEIRRLVDGEIDQAQAVFPEYQPSIDAISYRIRRLRTDQEEIVRTLNLRNDFIAHASHELKTPLTSIRGYAEMLREGMAETPEEQAVCVQTIHSESTRMLDVIEDILRLNKAERNPSAAASMTDVAPIAEEVRRALSPLAAKKSISIRTEGSLRVRAEEKDIREILYNLMDNAVRYGRTGGNVRVLMREQSLLVQDDGIGIAPEHVGHIFEQFYRVDETRDEDVSGTGLGLSIVKAIADRLGAVISVHSVPGEGTDFLIQFPAENTDD